MYTGGCYIIGANRAGKSARSLFNCISVTDGIKINEQYKSIGIGPLYLQTELLKVSYKLLIVYAFIAVNKVLAIEVSKEKNCKSSVHC